MPKACTMPGAIANTALTRGSCTSSAGRASSGSSLRRYSGTIGLLRQPRWKARYFSGLTRAPPTQSAVKPPCEWPATPIRSASIDLPRIGSFSRKLMLRATSRGALPELVREIGDG